MPESLDAGSLNGVARAMAELRRRFVMQLPARLEAIGSHVARLSGGAWTPGETEVLHRLVHSLSGTAGTFGLPALSAAARGLESALADGMRQCLAPGDAGWTQWMSTIEALHAGFEQAGALAAEAPRPQAPAGTGTAAVAGVACPDRSPLICVVAHDVELGQALAGPLEASGYRVQQVGSVQAFQALYQAGGAEAPDAVLLDTDLPESDEARAALVGTLRGPQGGIPVLVALENDDLFLRLAMARAGASRTVAKPVDSDRLTELLDALTGRQPHEPYRVLLVDDEPLLLEAQASMLRAAGMDVRCLSQPLSTLEALNAFEPDVLLLDVYMPEATGPELAAALRERDTHLHLPILFLSAETDMTQQLLALNLGGDDFLVKPVRPDHLVAAVTARARRARQSGVLRQRLETTLYEREREHLALGQHANVTFSDASGLITYANDRFCTNSGYARDELIGQRHTLVRSDLHAPAFYAALWNCISNGQVWHGEICSRRKDGSLYWVEATITPFLDRKGQVYQYVSIQTDISHIKRAEEALRMQRDMQRVISVSAARLMAAQASEVPAGIEAALRDSGVRLGADRAYLFVFSRDGQRMRRAQAWSAPGIPPLSGDLVNTPLELTPWLREQFLTQGLLRVPDVAGLPAEATADRLWLERHQTRALLGFPLQKDGKLFGFIGFSVVQSARDWTHDEVELLKVLCDVIAGALARQRAESALRKSEARLNFLVSSSPVTIYTRSAQSPHALVYVSSNLQQFMGWSPELGTTDTEFWSSRVHPEDRERVMAGLPDVLACDADLAEYRLRARDGSYRWVHDQRRLVRDAAGAPLEIIGYWMDITDRRRIEDELFRFNQELEHRVAEQTRSVVESERLARATLDALSARVLILDARGTVMAANRAWKASGGPEVVAEGDDYLAFCETEQCQKDRNLSELAAGIRAVMNGEAKNFLYEYGCHLGPEPSWHLCRVERFPCGGEPRTVVSHENITEMKRLERQQLRSQRLESLGTLAGGVAHDLNNALAPVLMGMGLLKEQYPQESKLFEMIQASAQRGAEMVRHLLTFAKGAEGERVPVQPVRLVRELENLMKGSFPKNIQLVLDCAETIPMVVGDPTQLHQILLNLCVNARDAMPEGGTLTLRAQQLEIDATYARSMSEARPGHYVALRVSDTGAGVPPEILDRIFDPFFTTKRPDKGTGLGLSTVLGIVKSHGGFVQVYSQPGQGATFAVYLPVAAGAPGAPQAAAAVAEFRGKGETILFVDDEAAVREVGRAVLERLNFTPVVATDGADGLLLAAEHRARLRAIVTDLHMPHMDGLAFVRALRRKLPDIPVVVASGRVDEAVAAELQSHGVTRRLDKPFTQAQLALLLQELLAPR